MARKRLNKKVALIGSLVFVLLVFVAIGAFLYLSRDPVKFIKDGDAALIAAREATDEEIKEETYKRAERNYHKARSLAKTDFHRIEILFKLVEVFIETDQWPNVLGCWNRIISIDSGNMKARFGQLKYVYIVADSGDHRLWPQIVSQASEFIEVAENADLLMEDTAKWQPSGMQERGPRLAERQRLGTYLYLLRGRANFELAWLGAVTDPDESLARATNDLKKVHEFEPNNVDAYWYLAQAVKTKGRILAARGSIEEKDKAADQAKEILKQAIDIAPAEPMAHINLLTEKVTQITEKVTQSIEAAQQTEKLKLLEPEYLLLVEKFPSSAQVYLALAGFYQFNLENLDKAIEAAKKAVELDKENVSYAIHLANLHYRNFSIYGQTQGLYKAIEVAKNALTLPDAQEKNGPREWANRMNRASLFIFLANCYIEQILEPCEVRTAAQKQQWITNAERTVYEIEQLFGSGEEVQVVKWRGMLELAKGNQNDAVKKLYAAYEQLKASGIEDAQSSHLRNSYAQLSYSLAKIFKNTTETGAVAEFLASALRSGITLIKPEARLDYVEVLIKLRNYDGALSVVNSFEDNYWADRRSKTLRINALFGAGQFDEVEKELAKMADAYPNDPNTIKLNLALVQAKIRQVQRAIVQKRVEDSEPIILQSTETPEKETRPAETSVQLMTDELKRYWIVCAGLVEKLLPMEPDNTSLLMYKQILSEPEPHAISRERHKELEKQVLSNIADPIRRAMSLGTFYQRHKELDKAAAEFQKVFSSDVVRDEYRREKDKHDAIGITQYETAASYLFDIALATEDLQLAEQIAETGQDENLDGCGGQYFTARLAMAKEQYKDALTKLDECLRQRPVFSRALLFRSSVNTALGNQHASIEDVRRAVSLNPLDGAIAKVLANVLYQRDKKLGTNVSSDQKIETRTALQRALRLNPGDLDLLSFYAEYISDDEPLRALAIRQNLQNVTPTVQNAVLLARLAMKMALRETNAKRKDALLAIADSSFEQAQAIAPENKAVLNARAEYYRLTGQLEKAKQLVIQDEKLLWNHYLRIGRLDDAKEVLEQLYKSGEKDNNVVKGLLLIAERQRDQDAVRKYSEELLSLEDSIKNRLYQIQTFLKIGLIREAEYKLQSFKEKHPQEGPVLLLEASLAMKQGQLKTALELTNRNLESNQDNPVAWLLRGRINLLMANYEQAINDLKLSKSLSDEPVTRVSLAKAYRAAGRYEDAITELKYTIDVPGAPMEARTLLEQIYLQLDRKEALKKFYNDTLQKLTDSVMWKTRVGAFAIAEGQFDRAEKLYSQAWQKSRNNARGDVAAFDGYLQALVLQAGTPGTDTWDPGKLDKVFEEARKYVDSYFAPIAYLRMGEGKLKLGDRRHAIQYCRKAVDKAGTSTILVVQTLQRMYTLVGPEEVLTYCKERLEADPDSLAANFAMFNLTKINDEYNKAANYMDKCLQIAGPDGPHRVNYIMEKAEVLTLAYNKTSDNNYLKKAIAEYESLLAEMPNNTIILNNLAYMLAKNDERLTEALQYAERSLQARPNSPALLDTYAYVLHKNGRNLEAAKSLQAALQQYETQQVRIPADVYEHLGMVKEKLGAQAEALAAYKQALQIGAVKLPKATEQRIKSAIERLSQ